MVWSVLVRSVRVRCGKVRCGRQGMAWRGWAWPVGVCFGTAGMARHGMVWLGGSGKVRLARQELKTVKRKGNVNGGI